MRAVGLNSATSSVQASHLFLADTLGRVAQALPAQAILTRYRHRQNGSFCRAPALL
jgi:hypothetical protein